MDMHFAVFGTAMQRRKHLAGVEPVLGIEGAFQTLLLLQIHLGEHFRHQVAFLHAYAMLASQHAADRDAKTQNIGAEGFGAFASLSLDSGRRT